MNDKEKRKNLLMHLICEIYDYFPQYSFQDPLVLTVPDVAEFVLYKLEECEERNERT